MLKIAICDDRSGERSETASTLQDYFKDRPRPAANLSLFEDGPSLLQAVEKTGGFDLYLLDVLMPGMSGIEVGKSLRSMGQDGAIIYLTTSPDYAVDSYLTQAFFYLLKPVERRQLFEVLDRALAAIGRRKDETAIVHTSGGLRSIPMDDILYLERVDRCVRYFLADGTTVDSRTIRGSLREEAAALLSDGRFILCGASFVLGLHHIQAVEKSEVRLDRGDRVPLSRASYGEVKRAWMEYWLGGNLRT